MDDGCSDGNGVLKAEVTIDKGKMLEIFKQLNERKIISDTGKRGFSLISRQISFKRIGAALTRQTEKKTFHCGLPSWLRATKLYLTDLSLPTCSLAPDIAIEHGTVEEVCSEAQKWTPAVLWWSVVDAVTVLYNVSKVWGGHCQKQTGPELWSWQ